MKEIGIIGAGISGLLTAYFLKKSGFKVSVFESASRCGGWIKSEKRDGEWLEWGPNTLMADRAWLELIQNLKLKPIFPAGNSRKRFIWKNSNRFCVPLNPLSFLFSPIISAEAKFTIFKDLIGTRRAPARDLSVSDFFRTYLHSDILDYLIEPFVRGIFSGNVDELSMEACFPKVWKGFQEKGSIVRGLFSQMKASKAGRRKMLSFEAGLEELPRALAHELGASLFLNHQVTEIKGKAGEGFEIKTSFGLYCCSAVVVTTPSGIAQSLLKSYIPSASSNFLLALPYRRVGVWNTIFERPKNFKSGFGCLVPRLEKTQLLGSLWPSEIFSQRSSGQKLVSSQFFSGQNIPEDPKIELPLLKKILGIAQDPLYSEMKNYSRAIPQFAIGHTESVKRLKESLPAGIYVAGNYLDGVGLTSVFETARETADRIYQIHR